MKNTRKLLMSLSLMFALFSFSSCSSSSDSPISESAYSEKDDSENQDSTIQSNLVESESATEMESETLTPIILSMNGREVKGTLNDTLTAREFKKLLPYTVQVSRATDDLCGSVSEHLDGNEEEQSHGWKKGEIGWFGGWFTILLDHEENFQDHDFMIIGSIDEEDLDYVCSLTGSVTIEIRLAESKVEENIMNLEVNGSKLVIDLVDNSSVDALKELLKDGPMTISMNDYASMEKVGSLGTTLPRNDEQITTEAGDVILYQGSAFVIYYAPNSWNFTRLGKIRNVTASSLTEILGDGAVTIRISL